MSAKNNSEINLESLTSMIYLFAKFLREVNSQKNISTKTIHIIKEDYEKITTIQQSLSDPTNQLQPYLEILHFQYNESIKRYLNEQQKTDFFELINDPILKQYMSNKKTSLDQNQQSQTDNHPDIISRFYQISNNLDQSTSSQNSELGHSLTDSKIDSKRNILKWNLESKFLNKFIINFQLYLHKIFSLEHTQSKHDEFQKELAKIKLYAENYNKIRGFDLEQIELEKENQNCIIDFEKIINTQKFRETIGQNHEFIDFCDKFQFFLKNLVLHKTQVRLRESAHNAEINVDLYQSDKTSNLKKNEDFNSQIQPSIKNKSSSIKSKMSENDIAGQVLLIDENGNLIDYENHLKTYSDNSKNHINQQLEEIHLIDEPEINSQNTNKLVNNDGLGYISLTNYQTPQNYHDLEHFSGKNTPELFLKTRIQSQSTEIHKNEEDKKRDLENVFKSTSNDHKKDHEKHQNSIVKSESEEFNIQQKRLSEKAPNINSSYSDHGSNSLQSSEIKSIEDQAKKTTEEKPKNLFIQNSNFSENESNIMPENIPPKPAQMNLEFHDGSFKAIRRNSDENKGNMSDKIQSNGKIYVQKNISNFKAEADLNLKILHDGLVSPQTNKKGSEAVLFNSFFNIDLNAMSSRNNVEKSPQTENKDEKHKNVSLQSFNESKIINNEKKPLSINFDSKEREMSDFERQKDKVENKFEQKKQENVPKTKNEGILENVNKDILISDINKSGLEKNKDFDISNDPHPKRLSDPDKNKIEQFSKTQKQTFSYHENVNLTELEKYFGSDFKKLINEKPDSPIIINETDHVYNKITRTTASFEEKPLKNEFQDIVQNQPEQKNSIRDSIQQPGSNKTANTEIEKQNQKLPLIHTSTFSNEVNYSNIKELSDFSNIMKQYDPEAEDNHEISKPDLLNEFKKLFDKMDVSHINRHKTTPDRVKFIDQNFPPLIYSVLNDFAFADYSNKRYFQWKRISNVFSKTFKIVFKCEKASSLRFYCSNEALIAVFMSFEKIGDDLIDFFVKNYERNIGRITLKSFIDDTPVFMDDFLPVQVLNGLQNDSDVFNFAHISPLFEGNEVNIFFSVLEKYCAKILGSFENLQKACFEDLLKLFSHNIEIVNLKAISLFNQTQLTNFCKEIFHDLSTPMNLIYFVNEKEKRAVHLLKTMKKEKDLYFFNLEDLSEQKSMNLAEVVSSFEKIFILTINFHSSKNVVKNPIIEPLK